MTETPPALARSRGLLTDRQLETLQRSSVLIAGVGGVGGRLAETLTRMGVGRLDLADPDVFTETNLNRQAGCTRATLHQNKAEVLADLCREIGMADEIRAYPNGVDPENVVALTAGAAVVVDATDYTQPSIGLRLARAARAADVPNVMGVEVGFGAWHTVLAPGSQSFERLFGLRPDVTPEDLESGVASIALWRWVQRVPRYVDPQVLADVEAGRTEAPAIAVAVELSAALLATDVVRLLLDLPVVATAPRIHFVDAALGTSSIIRPNVWRFRASLLRALRS